MPSSLFDFIQSSPRNPQPSPATLYIAHLPHAMGLMALDQCTPLYLQMDHTTQPQMSTSSFHLLPEETSTPSFQEIPKVTETIHPSESEISSASAWQKTWPWWCFHTQYSALQHPFLLFHLKTNLQIPHHTLYTTSTQEPVSAPKKDRQNDCPQISWDHKDAVLLLLLAPQPWWQLAYSLCTPLPVTVHFTLLKKLTFVSFF